MREMLSEGKPKSVQGKVRGNDEDIIRNECCGGNKTPL